MPDIREVAQQARGKRTWSVAEINAALPSMKRELVEKALARRWGTSCLGTVGPGGWHSGPGARAVHWFVRGWALCGWGSINRDFGRGDEAEECGACRREVERTKVA